ncbi:hypothetical protein [Ethanoligenens harbinense]|uniref:Lipoprotein n=1 Tax=Ethanoligenens harbinense (strain DSM 18485 / JCM 12961 / CGMCC 1.5033 / YUAN-3) TaxID=663278 RepID=E6U2T5_ETHHY|nr:hypothetical protein [Ethanoligenens harbinense]ADU27477.1 hypothetical protein Ethha_1959 [Ethanoligenens harbinense YUAN-3]AVQ96534.1 hypothetical protein CXQ68_10035 [Ethanoligenens harbinense YUAN-3]AYF39196.1 hypothetical protein CXP51_09925 [Ethanoligenens harbinense]AYF42019.1 hypothetical protein CN246_10475 [Ethanoligenens harbinense]QCN92774.1 hypothetical protein DRA42_10065 [Ethanoligenens harbinense]
MRKTVEILLFVLTALLFVTAFVSCRAKDAAAGKQAASALSGAFSCTADVTLSGHDYTVDIVRLADGGSTVQFVRPAELSQLSFLSNKDGMSVRFGAMQAKLDPASVPQSSVCSALLGAFETAAKSGSAAHQGVSTVLKGQSAAGPFTLVLDGQNRPQSLQIPRLNLAATIHDFTAS